MGNRAKRQHYGCKISFGLDKVAYSEDVSISFTAPDEPKEIWLVSDSCIGLGYCLSNRWRHRISICSKKTHQHKYCCSKSRGPRADWVMLLV